MNKAEGIAKIHQLMRSANSPLASIIPVSVVSEVESLEDFGIDTNLRLAHFLAQCAHESAGFKYKVENLNYSEQALKKVFGKYFPGDLAKDYARKPEKIASRVYANRMGNGDEDSADGWKYRGRGFLQITGRNNYESLGKDINCDLRAVPELVSDKYPLLSGAWFFQKNRITQMADEGATHEVVKKITRRVNGGYHGLTDRQEWFKKIWTILS